MNKRTQRAEILKYLRTWGSMTTSEAIEVLRILSPAKRVEELRREGHPIRTVYEKGPNGTRYGVYVLE